MSHYTRIEIPRVIGLSVNSNGLHHELAAALVHSREAVPQLQTLSASISLRECHRPSETYIDIGWTGHGSGKCVSGSTIDGVVVQLGLELANNPQQRAADARFRAKLLLKEAKALEAVARGITGRVA